VKCSNCGRGMREPAGYVSGAPVGPTCLANMVGRAEVRRSRKTVVVAVDQPDLFEHQPKENENATDNGSNYIDATSGGGFFEQK
jgi:hypothetical protein